MPFDRILSKLRSLVRAPGSDYAAELWIVRNDQPITPPEWLAFAQAHPRLRVQKREGAVVTAPTGEPMTTTASAHEAWALIGDAWRPAFHLDPSGHVFFTADDENLIALAVSIAADLRAHVLPPRLNPSSPADA